MPPSTENSCPVANTDSSLARYTTMGAISWAWACELLGGALTGSGTWHRPTDPAVRAVINGMLTILIDPARLGTQAAFEQEAVAFIDWLTAGPVAPGFDAVQIAGDPERVTRLKREVEGIAIDHQTWQEIVAAGRKVGITLPT